MYEKVEDEIGVGLGKDTGAMEDKAAENLYMAMGMEAQREEEGDGEGTMKSLCTTGVLTQ